MSHHSTSFTLERITYVRGLVIPIYENNYFNHGGIDLYLLNSKHKVHRISPNLLLHVILTIRFPERCAFFTITLKRVL